MANYTKLSNNDINRLTSYYDMGSIIEVESLDGGLANSSVKIKTQNGIYTLSICDEKNMEEIECLTTVLRYLEKYDFPTTHVIKTKECQPVIEYAGKPVYVKRFIEGEVYRQLDSDMVYQLGEKLGLLHLIPPHRALATKFSYGIESFNEASSWPEKSDFGQWIKEKHIFLEGSMRRDLPKGFIHGDLFHDNCLFTKQKLVAILDFEEACFYYNLFDLGMCAIGSCSPDGLLSLELVKSLVSGYQNIRELDSIEKDQLQVFTEYPAIATSFWRYRQYHIRNPDKANAGRHLEMKSIADQVHSIPSESFFKAVF